MGASLYSSVLVITLALKVFERLIIHSSGQQISLEYLHIIINIVANAPPCVICLNCIVWAGFAYTRGSAQPVKLTVGEI